MKGTEIQKKLGGRRKCSDMAQSIMQYYGCFLISLVFFNLTAQETTNFDHLEKTFWGGSQIAYDSIGYVWITGNQGLYKYDGYDYLFTPFTSIFGEEFKNPRSILFEKDNKENFWLASYSGELMRMTPDGAFTSFKDSLSFGKDRVVITAIQPEENGVWLGSSAGIVFRYDYAISKIDSITTIPESKGRQQLISDIAFTDARTMWIGTEEGKVYQHSQRNSGSPLKELVGPYQSAIKGSVALTADNETNLWIATANKGLFSYNVNQNSFQQYDGSDKESSKGKHPLFISIFYDTSGKIWAGTDGDGLYRIDLETNNAFVYKHQSTNKFAISNNTVTDVSKDIFGNIWAVTKNGYIDILPNSSNKIAYFSGSENGSPTPALCVLKTTEGSIWTGTDGFGLNRVYPNGTSVQYTSTKNSKLNFEGKYIQRMVEGQTGTLWIGTYQVGLHTFNLESERFRNIPITDGHGNSATDIRFLFKDSKNRIWVSSDIGMHVYSAEQKQIASFTFNTNGLAGDISQGMNETKDGTIWIGVNNGGLFKFIENIENLSNSSFEKRTYFNREADDTGNYNIASIEKDNKNNLWILCVSGYLIYYDTSTNAYTSYRNKKGLENIQIRAVLQDSKENLWLSSSSGIHEYTIENGAVKSFYQTDGMQGDSYMLRSSYKAENNMLFFGGKNGVSAFFPENTQKRESSATLFINTIEILNQPAERIIPEQLNGGIENLQTIALSADQSSFSFRFSAVENVLNPNYHYSYRLQNFDEDWITAKPDRIATYTNVPSGNYFFEVKAGTKRDQWDIEPKQIEINIKPYWWRSTLAYILYTIFMLALVYGIYRWIKLRNRVHKEELEYTNEKEMYALKMNFFAKMSHEIQTPLTLILGPIDDMLQKATSNKNRLLTQRLTLIKNNAERLSRISGELTTLRDKELNQLKIRASKENIITHLEEICLSFAEQARFKKIDFIQHFPEEGIKLWYDRDKIEHVVYNLLSNAFKFTPVEGTVTLKVTSDTQDEKLKIAITDSGPGISEDELEPIFTLFYQSDIGKQLKGSGIGLALTKELIDLHHGTIDVTSSEEHGTAFTVQLSLQEDIFKTNEKINLNTADEVQFSEKDALDALEEDLIQPSKKKQETKHNVLIVEDNVEMQIFLKELLSASYSIEIAENGEQGITAVENRPPDIIISDVMMPKMDGLEMSKKLQKNNHTANIPIVLLTAKNTTKSKLLGLRSGAVDYIQKPFNPQELVIKVRNIIANKEKAISKVKTDMISNPQTDATLSKDHIFLKDLVTKLSGQLENSEFKLKELSHTMNMSYSVIYRKCQEITGKTLVDFFRGLKMKRAALLIIEQHYNISEAAFMVGYKDPKYFSKCFKDEFGKPPASLKREAEKMQLKEFIEKYELQIT